MPDYESLDLIADSYNPLLALILLLLIARYLLRRDWRAAGRALLGFVTVAGVAYGLMLLDRAVGIWPALGLDYSTHTAEALGLVLLLSLELRKLRLVWTLSLGSYLLLMLYQRYHTAADIVTSSLAVALLLVLLLMPLYRAPRGLAANQPADLAGG